MQGWRGREGRGRGEAPQSRRGFGNKAKITSKYGKRENSDSCHPQKDELKRCLVELGRRAWEADGAAVIYHNRSFGSIERAQLCEYQNTSLDVCVCVDVGGGEASWEGFYLHCSLEAA